MNVEAPREQLQPGAVVADRYRIISFVAAGGMGAIYRAQHTQNNRVAALKIMRPELAADASAAKRFKREIKVVSQLQNEYTITPFDFGETADGGLYLVMEWLEGQDLAHHLIDRGALEPKTAVRYLLQVARSLREAHAKDIIHRDLKPENIFLTQRGDELQVKVLDFGLAKMVGDDAQTQITRIGTVCGTPEFMSPEQARAEDLDGRSDIYALGCVLYTTLTGQPPYTHENPLQVVMFHQNNPIPDLPEHLPRSLNAIIQKSTHKKPRKRYADAAAMIKALEGFLETADEEVEEALETAGTLVMPELGAQDVRSAPTTVMEPTARASTSRGPVIALVAAVVLVAVGIVAALVLSGGEEEAAPASQPAPAETEAADDAPDAPAPEVTVAITPEGARVILDDQGQALPTPLTLPNPEGLDHTLTIIPPDGSYVGKEVPLKVEAGVTKTVEIALDPS